MFYEETEKLSKFFKYAIVLIVIVGFIGGICLGFALEGPTAEALEAMEDIINYPSLADDGRWDDTAAQTAWTSASVGAMLGMWVVSAISALLLYAKKCQLEMMEYISRRINDIAETHNIRKRVETTME